MCSLHLYSQLQTYHHVVLHATDLATQSLALLSEHVDGAFELQRIHMQLLAQTP